MPDRPRVERAVGLPDRARQSLHTLDLWRPDVPHHPVPHGCQEEHGKVTEEIPQEKEHDDSDTDIDQHLLFPVVLDHHSEEIIKVILQRDEGKHLGKLAQ